MLWLLGGIAFLILGYSTYGRYVEGQLKPDQRETPAVRLRDNVDFVPLPEWKNLLIQLLNIAGIGPVIGVILGIKFGWICFLVIPIGNVLGGAVHDFVSGFLSVRYRGANLPELTARTFGKTYAYVIFGGLVTVLLALVVAVFINIPAKLTVNILPQACTQIPGGVTTLFWMVVVLIFLYYILATLFSVDKLIGRIYPFFGAMLLLGTGAVFCALVYALMLKPDLLVETEAFKAGILKQPVIPCLFVTIACGIISGFHATQSPIVARTMKSERQCRATFYGMMIAEGVIAVVWAAAGMAIYNLQPELMAHVPADVLVVITTHFLGNGMGVVTVLSVIILAVTSGDTALRSLRLIVAEIFSIEQTSIRRRLLITVPLGMVVISILWWSNRNAQSFSILWNYFAWANQLLATSTLMMCTTCFARKGRNYWVTLLPGIFMAFIVISFILWTDPSRGGPIGFGLDLYVSYVIAAVISIGIGIFSVRLGKKRAETNDLLIH